MKPKFAIPIGDPNGIGPEIVLKSFLNNNFANNAIPIVFADPDILQFYINLFAFDLKPDIISNIENVKFQNGIVTGKANGKFSIHIGNSPRSRA